MDQNYGFFISSLLFGYSNFLLPLLYLQFPPEIDAHEALIQKFAGKNFKLFVVSYSALTQPGRGDTVVEILVNTPST